MVEASHDLDLLEDVGTLREVEAVEGKGKGRETKGKGGEEHGE